MEVTGEKKTTKRQGEAKTDSSSSSSSSRNKNETTTTTTTTMPPPLPPGWTRCQLYMAQKRRYCRQHVLANSIYCGNHQEHQQQQTESIAAPSHSAFAATAGTPAPDTLTTTSLSSSSSNLKQQPALPARRRVPCPLDHSHSVFEHKMAQHVRKCPSVQKKKRVEEATYFSRNINKGGHGQARNSIGDHFVNGLVGEEEQDGGQLLVSAENELDWAQRVALAVLKVHDRLFRSVTASSSSSNNNDVRDVKALTLEDVQNSLNLEDLAEHELQQGLEGDIEAYRIKSGGSKHLHQQASLVGHLRELGALPSSSVNVNKRPRTEPLSTNDASVTFFEMGAGRGMLGLVAAGVSATRTPTSLVLVERSGSRSKAETVLRNIPQKDVARAGKASEILTNGYLDLENLQWSRIKCDLAHVNMETVINERKESSSSSSQMHVIAKHLCGAGTDLALKALEPIRHEITSCLFATCCHGVCGWEDYVGRDYLRQVFHDVCQITLNHAEFELLRRWSAGTVLTGTKDDDADGHPAAKKNNDEDNDARSPVAIGRVVDSLELLCGVQGLGRCCQRLIDYGRREYMEKVLFEGKGHTNLLHYVPPSITPQNAVILGHRR